MVVAVLSRPGGKCRLVGNLAADDVDTSDEGQPVGVKPGRFGGLGHQCAYGVVGQQQAPEFLADEFGGLGAEPAAGLEHLGLDLFQGYLVFPALLVGRGQLGGGQVIGVEDRGDQPEDFWPPCCLRPW